MSDDENQNLKREEYEQKDGKNSLNEDNNKILITEVNTINKKKKYNKRRNYLKEKLDNLNVSNDLKNEVSSGIEKAKENFKNEFITQPNIIVKDNPNNLILILEKSKSSKQNIMSKEALKQLKLLKISEENTINSIVKLEKNKKIIENESIKNIKGGIVEQNIRIAKINSIEDKKNLLQMKLENINNQIDEIMNNNKPNKKEILSNFIENFEKDKEEYQQKIKEYEKQSNEIKEKMKKDKLISSKRREKELEQNEKEDLDKKEKLFQERKEKEHNMFLKRKKEIEEKYDISKPFMKKKFKKSERDYLYYKNKEQFELNEQLLVDRVNMQKKEFITLQDIKENVERLKEQKEILDEEIKEKKRKLKDMWINRSQILPSFKSQISKICEEDDKEKYMNYEDKKRKIAELENHKIEYSKKNIPKPLISKKLKVLREKRLIKEDKNSVLLTEKNNKKRNNFYYVSPPKKKIENNNLEKETNDYSNIKNSDDENLNNLISKRQKRFLKPIQIHHPKPEKPINYLDDIIKKRQSEEKRSHKKIRVDINLNNSETQTGNIIEQLDIIKGQTDALDNEVKQKKEFMKLNGGYEQNPLLGDELGDMLLESIQAKLNVISQLKKK